PPPEALPDLPRPAPQLALLSSDTAPAAETAPPPPKPKPKADAKPPAPEKPAKPPVQKAKPPAGPAPSGAKAAGSGGGTTSGRGGKAEASGLSKSEVADLKAAWGAKIQAQIERRRTYPRDAGRAEGVVRLELTVAPSGALLAVRVIKSSGAAVLDRAAVKAAQSAGRFPKAPAQLTGPAYKLILQLKYDRRG
uniref:energy transducer TonB family protein n=1 Tax=Xinfangfangia pollutisoli TaxID=2865960 RepID=UPI001CD22BD3